MHDAYPIMAHIQAAPLPDIDDGDHQSAVLAALDYQIAVLDRQGTITQVNEAWLRFARQNGAAPDFTGIGLNYLEVCRLSLGACPETQKVLEGIQAVMDGSLPRFRTEYRCDSPAKQRWYVMTVTPLAVPEGGVVVSHHNITKYKKTKDEHKALLETVRAIVWRAKVPGLQTTYLSKQAETVLGYPVDRWLNEPDFWVDHIHPGDRNWVLAVTTNAIQNRRGFGFEYRMIAADGRTVWLRIAGDVVVDEGRVKEIVGIQGDISDRKQVELALRESEERFRLVANSAPVLIWMSGTDKLCNYFNQNWLEFTGRSLEEEMGNGWAEGVHPEDRQACLDTYVRAFDRREPFQMNYRLRRHDGEYRWILDTGVPRFAQGGPFLGYIGSCTDVTEHKLAEEALASVSRRLIQAQEEERTRIARELHDDINQRIAFLAIDLDKSERWLPESAVEAHSQIADLRQRVLELGKEVQALSHRLHSSKLEYLGIVGAAHSFCRELSEQQNVKIDFEHSGIPQRVPKEIALCLFRVLQEALQNAVKYSGVAYFKVELRGSPAQIQLTVRDEGIGFDQQEAMKRQGLGLISMRERLQLVNGQFSISATPGAGTIIHASVPLPKGIEAEPMAMPRTG